MALKTELLTVLDNSNEPLEKRLRFANNVFSSNKFTIFNKESILFNWLSKNCLKIDNPDTWNTLHKCIMSTHMKTLKPNEINHDVLNSIVKVIIKRLKQNSNTKNEIIQCGLSILNISIFRHYFEYELKLYCQFVSIILVNIDNIEDATNIFNTLLRNQSIIVKDNFNIYFFTLTFEAVINVLLKFSVDVLFTQVVNLIQCIIFPTKMTNFSTYLTSLFDQNKSSDESSSNMIIDIMKIIYNCETQIAKIGFKILFLAFQSVSNIPLDLYKFFILIITNLGFNTKKIIKINLPKYTETDLETSLEILAEILEIFVNKNITINDSLNETSFADFLNSLANSIIAIQKKPNLSTLKILNYIISIEPLTVESSICEILHFITLSKKQNDLQLHYAELFISILRTYLKLHRIPKFCEEFLETMQKSLLSNFKIRKPEISFNGDINDNETPEHVNRAKQILSEDIVKYFQECITLLSSNQVANIMKIFTNGLEEIAENFQTFTQDENKILYIEIVCDLWCQYLSAVRFAEHTTPEHIINNFINEMQLFKELLKKFGTALLQVEHNHIIMSSFLNVCYIWAEVIIMLMYYSPSENVDFRGKLDNNHTVHNLTYLHNYLSAKQWSLIAQRIKNFGEPPCKRTLQTLIIQKFKAMLIFETEINETVESSIITNYSSNLESCWDIILTERFIASTFVPKMEGSQLILLAELIINDVIAKNNFNILKLHTIEDSRYLATSILYVCLSKISSLFKRKRKHDASTKIRPTSVNIFKNIDSESFIQTEKVDLLQITENFNTDLGCFEDITIEKDSFCTYLEILKYVPVCFLSHEVQATFFFYLLSVCYDLKKCRSQNTKCLEKCEQYLLALVENNTSPNVFNYMNADTLLQIILECVINYKQIVYQTVTKALKENNTIISLKSAISLIETNMSEEKYLQIAITTSNMIRKKNMAELSVEDKEIINKYAKRLNKKLLKNIKSSDTVTTIKVESFIVLLKNYLKNNDEDGLDELTFNIQPYIEYSIDNMKQNKHETCLQFLKFLMNSNIKNVPKDFLQSIWKSYKNTIDRNSFIEISILFLENASNDEFPLMLNDFLLYSLKYLQTQELNEFKNLLKLWKRIILLTLPDQRMHHVINCIKKLLENIIVFLASNNDNQKLNLEIVNFQIKLIENPQKIQTSDFIDINFITAHILISKQLNYEKFISTFEMCFPILESLLKYHEDMLVDRLPTYLLHYRLFLHQLCLNSNSDLNLTVNQTQKLSDCAFRLQKLTNHLRTFKRHIARIASYVIADIVKEHKKITFYPEIKNHLNNCVVDLVDLCDYHDIAFIRRNLKEGSIEIFNNIYNYYLKYCKFRGKV